MRDFHVSPAMGSEGTSAPTDIEEIPKEETDDMDASDRFRRIVKLAMTPKVAVIASAVAGKALA